MCVHGPVSDRLALCLSRCGQEEPTYSALWGDNKGFDEVIISPAMLNEHMPHMVMEGLNKVWFILQLIQVSLYGGVFQITERCPFTLALDFHCWVIKPMASMYQLLLTKHYIYILSLKKFKMRITL